MAMAASTASPPSLRSTLRMLSPTLLSIYLHPYDLPLLSSVSRDMQNIVRQELIVCEKRRRMKDEAQKKEIRQQLDEIEIIRSKISNQNSSSTTTQSQLNNDILTHWTLLFSTHSTPLPHNYLHHFHSLIFHNGASLQYDDHELGSGEGVCDAIALCGRWMEMKRDSPSEFRHKRIEEVCITISAIRLALLSNPRLWRNRTYVGNGGMNIFNFTIWTIIHARNYYGSFINITWMIEHEILKMLYELLVWMIHLLEVVAEKERMELEEKLRQKVKERDTNTSQVPALNDGGGDTTATSDSPPTIDSNPPTFFTTTYPTILNSRSDIISDHPIIEFDILYLCLYELWPSRYKRNETYTVENGVAPEHVRQWKMVIQKGVIQACAESIELNPRKETFEKEMDDYRARQYLSRLPADRLDLIMTLFSLPSYRHRFFISLQYCENHSEPVKKNPLVKNPIKAWLNLFFQSKKMREKLKDLIEMIGGMMKDGEIRTETAANLASSSSAASSSTSVSTSSSSSSWSVIFSPSSNHDPLLRRFLTSLYFDMIRRKDFTLLKYVHRMLLPPAFPTFHLLREQKTGLSPLRYYLKKKTRCSTSIRVFDELLRETMRGMMEEDGDGGSDVVERLLEEKENGETLKQTLMKPQNRELWDRVVVMMEQRRNTAVAADTINEKKS